MAFVGPLWQMAICGCSLLIVAVVSLVAVVEFILAKSSVESKWLNVA